MIGVIVAGDYCVGGLWLYDWTFVVTMSKGGFAKISSFQHTIDADADTPPPLAYAANDANPFFRWSFLAKT